jgi:putrescine---pyruvate transaminase
MDGATERETRMWNPFANMATLPGAKITITGGDGAIVFDDRGAEYIDAIASLWYCNIGHGRAELADAAAEQMGRLAAYQTFELYTNEPAEALAERVAGLAPFDGARVFFTPGGGSDAVDTAGKLSRAYWAAVGQPTKRAVIGRSNAYHGMNAYGTSLTGIAALTSVFEPLVVPVEHVPWNDAAALAESIDRLGPGNVAAFFCEPVIGAGGVLLPPEGYLAEVERICRDRDVLFVADEVVCGFGRLGEWFGSARLSLRPDMMTVAKGLTSGYAPLGAVVVGERIAEPFWAKGTEHVFRHGYTYSAHPTSCAVALANLDVIEREGLVQRVRDLEPVLERALKPLADHPLVAAVRSGLGLLGAVETKEAARAERPDLVPRLVKEIRERGVLTRGLRGMSLQVSPPFVISEPQIEDIARAFGDALDALS